MLDPVSIKKISIIVPAHNEQQYIKRCLVAIHASINYLAKTYPTILVAVIVVMDSCQDDTQKIVENYPLLGHTLVGLRADYKNVGKVRALGVSYAIEHQADWIACTDADSKVAEDWLVAQMTQLATQPCDMICGVVSVDSWEGLSQRVKSQYLAHYQDVMGHRHIHGANLSFLATSYQKVGGFSELASHEDVNLVEKFTANELIIVWSNKVRVITSSRLEARAKEGFAHFLATL